MSNRTISIVSGVVFIFAASGSAALADPTGVIVDPDKPASNVETVRSPASVSGDATGLSPTAIVAPSVQRQPVTEPRTALDPDASITEQLHALANGKFDRIIGSTKERESIDAFYASRNYAPLWITEMKANARAKAVVAYLGGVAADGLDPTDYPVPNFTSLADPAALAEAEISLTTSVILYAHHAQIGRVHWSHVSGDIFYDQSTPDPGDILATMAQAKDAGEALAAYEPHAEAYLALKAKLAEVRAASGTPIPNGPSLKIGMRDERVPLLRSRLDVASEGATYDKELADAVKKFQERHELKPTGALDPSTVKALNGRRSDRQIEIIIANMERWRWMPHVLGNLYVIVNLPDYTLRVIHQGKQVWMTKVVAGKPATPTPIMSAQMKSITVNPTWNVPDSIAANECLPLLQRGWQHSSFPTAG